MQSLHQDPPCWQPHGTKQCPILLIVFFHVKITSAIIWQYGEQEILIFCVNTIVKSYALHLYCWLVSALGVSQDTNDRDPLLVFTDYTSLTAEELGDTPYTVLRWISPCHYDYLIFH